MASGDDRAAAVAAPREPRGMSTARTGRPWSETMAPGLSGGTGFSQFTFTHAGRPAGSGAGFAAPATHVHDIEAAERAAIMSPAVLAA